MTEPDRILGVAEAELANTRRLIGEHLKACTAAHHEPGSLSGACPDCRSLAVHLERCMDRIELLASGEAETGALF